MKKHQLSIPLALVLVSPLVMQPLFAAAKGAGIQTAAAVDADMKPFEKDESYKEKTLTEPVSERRAMESGEVEKVLERFRAVAEEQKVPAAIVKLVTKDSIVDTVGDRSSNNLGDQYYLYWDKGLMIEMYTPSEDVTLLNFDRYRVRTEDLAAPYKKSSSVNPATKKPYFSLDAKLAKKVDDAEMLARLKKIHLLLNANFGAIMTMPLLSENAYASGALMGKVIQIPCFAYNKRPPFIKADDDEEKEEIRACLGYELGNLVDVCKNSETISLGSNPIYYGSDVFEPKRELIQSFVKFGGELGDGIYYLNICSSDLYESVATNMVYSHWSHKERYLEKLQLGLAKLAKMYDLEVDGDKAKLSAEEQIISSWVNTLEWYILRLKAVQVGSMIPVERINLMKKGSLAFFLGKEMKEAPTKKDKEKIEEFGKKMDEKRKPWRDKNHAAYQDYMKKKLKKEGKG